MKRSTRWLAGTLLMIVPGLPLLVLLVLLCLTWFGCNWARAPLEGRVLAATGRELHIDGDLGLLWAWPAMRWRAQGVRFANPDWALEPLMVAADRVELSLDLRELLQGRLAISELRLTRPKVQLERSGLRRTWLLDLAQSNEGSRIPIGHVLLDQGELHYLDRGLQTDIHAALQTAAGRLAFTAAGSYLGQRLAADGEAGSVMAWRDDSQAYPIHVRATLDHTQVRAEGTLTDLHAFSGVDLQLALGGDSLSTLYPLIGVALPPTPAYTSKGHLLRSAGVWRYEGFDARIGSSEMTGSLSVAPHGTRQQLSGEVNFQRLNLADLRPAAGVAALTVVAAPRVLPTVPLDISYWGSLDADVALRVQALENQRTLPIQGLRTRLVLSDSRLTLDPIDFSWAGGQVTGQLALDGRTPPLRGHAALRLRGVALASLLPATAAKPGLDMGRLEGDADLSGQGASLGRMLAAADGHLRLVARDGQVSRLLMEQSGLHLLEILQLSLAGDETVRVNCAIADFSIARGVMRPRKLVLDTAVNTLVGDGQVDLGSETLDLRIVPHTKRNSIVALRAPVHLHGSFAEPLITLESSRVALRGAGALALGLVNPLLALVPLFEAGPGVSGVCDVPANKS